MVRFGLPAALVAAAIPLLGATAPTPAPTAMPALKTIATVRSTSRCAQIITHANSAITSALNNDSLITQTITQLRSYNLDDGNPIHRNNGLRALGDMAKTLMMQSRAADDEVKRLRTLAAASKDPQEAKDLKDFADELGGALWSQQKIARDLNGYLASVDFHDMAKFDEDGQNMNVAVFGVPDPLAQPPVDFGTNATRRTAVPPQPNLPPLLGHDPNEPTATQYAKNAADDFTRRIPLIQADEGHAATHVDGALAGC